MAKKTINERLTKIEVNLYGNGGKGIVHKLEDTEKNIDEFKKNYNKNYNKLDKKITIIIVFLALTLGGEIMLFQFLGK